MGTNFIRSAISHPGAATAAAKAEGLTVRQWALKHQHDPGTTGKRARLALTLENMHGEKASPLSRAAAGGQ